MEEQNRVQNQKELGSEQVMPTGFAALFKQAWEEAERRNQPMVEEIRREYDKLFGAKA